MFYRVFVVFLFSSFCLNVFCKGPEDVIINYTYLPPTINYYPQSKEFSFDDKDLKWNPSNNLRRKTGSSFFALGEPLLLEGYITDIDGIPLDGVRVKIIQTNANGIYNQMVGHFDNTDALYDSNFAGNGVTITDNRGYYNFLTVFPGYYNNRAPHIHVRFEHPNAKTIETEIFFINHPRNKEDYKYQKLTAEQKNLVTADVLFLDSLDKAKGKRAIFNVVLNISQENKTL